MIFSYSRIKRFFDFIFSFFLLIILSPLFLLISFLVFLDVGWPIFFIQSRPGFNAITFALIKFRTMISLDKSSTSSDSDCVRLTKFGRLLRSSSLDEIPELLNILLGHMSFVGPRPLLLDYLEFYSSFQAKRHLVLPGLTGFSQVYGRNSITWRKRFRFDVYYVYHQSFSLDFYIILLTIAKVISRDGISFPGHATMTRFTGSE